MLNKKGFTLIEILLVMLIIGITIGFAAIAFGDFGSARRLRIYAEHFESYVSLLQQRSILEGQTIGIQINTNSYTPFAYQTAKGWQPITGQTLFTRQHLPANMQLKAKLAERTSSKLPLIIIHPSGDMDPFILTLTQKNLPNCVTIAGTHAGKLQIEDCAKPS